MLTYYVQWNPIDVTAHRDSSDRPYAFVQLRSYEDARDALRERRGALVFDRPIRCEHARVNRALFLASSTNKYLNRPVCSLEYKRLVLDVCLYLLL